VDQTGEHYSIEQNTAVTSL